MLTKSDFVDEFSIEVVEVDCSEVFPLYSDIVNRSMVNKPKEFAHLLRDKFGSADQINMLGVYGVLSERLYTLQAVAEHFGVL